MGRLRKYDFSAKFAGVGGLILTNMNAKIGEMMYKSRVFSTIIVWTGIVLNLLLLSLYGYTFALNYPRAAVGDLMMAIILIAIFCLLIFPLVFIARLLSLTHQSFSDDEIFRVSLLWFRIFFFLQMVTAIIEVAAGWSVLLNYRAYLSRNVGPYEKTLFWRGVFMVSVGLYNAFIGFFGIGLHRRVRKKHRARLLKSFG